jgi:hypothetical protein
VVKELLSECLPLHGQCLEGIARKYYVYPGITNVSASPFSNIDLQICTDLSFYR